MNDHVVVCGYGTKGRSAVDALLTDGTPKDRIVVVEQDAAAVREAAGRGLAVVQGSSTRSAVLAQARVDRARSVIVATNVDDAAVLTVLTARDLAPRAWIVAAVREAENVPLVRQSGADQAIVSSETAGRLLGLSTVTPQLVTVVEDLLTVAEGLALTARPVAEREAGHAPLELDQPVVAVVRDGRLHRYDDPAVQRLEVGDRVVCVAVADQPVTAEGTGTTEKG